MLRYQLRHSQSTIQDLLAENMQLNERITTMASEQREKVPPSQVFDSSLPISQLLPAYLLTRTADAEQFPPGLYRLPWKAFSEQLGLTTGSLHLTKEVFQQKVRSARDAQQLWTSSHRELPIPVIV